MPKTTSAVQTYRFDIMATMINDRVDDPAESGVERYVGLEHLDADSLKIRRWGDITDVESTKLRFKPGDIIFGKRRVYQRKLAVADFEGICSAHAMVLRARHEVVLPEFLPFFMQSDLFMDRALAISVGSLSPTINWTDLAAQEFALPPIEAQWQLLRQLRSFDATCEGHASIAESCRVAIAALSEQHAVAAVHGAKSHRGVLQNGWRHLTIRELCEGENCGLTLGPFGSDLVVEDYGKCDHGTPVLFVADVQRFCLEHVSKRFISEDKHASLRAHEALPGDVLVTEMGWPPGEACVVPDGWPPSIIKADLIRARVNPSLVLPHYLVAILNSHWGQRQIVRISPGTTRPRMTLRDFRDIRIATPPIGVQRAFTDAVEQLQEGITTAERRAHSLRVIKRLALERMWPRV
ncbi:MAG: restriction endonuclease subunit S [Phycisphaerales bacterium]|nr:restriction endonuclease subunit S [Phycisphaerales bacterium]